jgi:putative flippase GtrA
VRIERRFIKFLFVGGLNTVFGYGMYALFTYLGFHYSLASLFSTIIGVLFNFITVGQLVFHNKNKRLLIKFAGVYVVIYLLNLLGLRVLHVLHFNLYLAGALLVLPLALLSYGMNKKIVFKEESV